MCGIAGIIDYRNGTVSRQALARMKSALRHRGPDGEGIYAERESGIALFHNRLSIIDLSQKARQPMKRGRYIIAYNGEIYNFREIRRDLEEAGRRFSSDSDAEVVCLAYAEWGRDCLRRFRGMFSFCIWDSETGSAFLARDRFGLKPLYYSDNGAKFIFSSEIRAIMASREVGAEEDHEAAGRFLSLGYIPPPKTIYRKVSALEPGHYLLRTAAKTVKKRYYDLAEAFEQPPLEVSDAEAAERARTGLAESVRHHLVSDVEVGAFLSGGVDSSSIVSLMRGCGRGRIKTVTVALPGSELDECSHASRVAKAFDTDLIRIDLQERDLARHLGKIFRFMDQPTVDGVNTYFVSLAAKEAGLKVALSGVGGDELFGGYPSFTDLPRICARRRTASLSDAYFAYRGIFSQEDVGRILGPAFGRNAGRAPAPHSGGRAVLGRFRDEFSRIAYLESKYYMSGQLLRDADAFSMAHAVEIRTPFVDHKLIELMARIPARQIVGKGPKELLVKAVGDLPREVYKRRKMGFTLPFDAWLRGGLRDTVAKTLRHARIYDQAYIGALIDAFDHRRLHWSRIWCLFVLASWQEIMARERS